MCRQHLFHMKVKSTTSLEKAKGSSIEAIYCFLYVFLHLLSFSPSNVPLEDLITIKTLVSSLFHPLDEEGQQIRSLTIMTGRSYTGRLRCKEAAGGDRRRSHRGVLCRACCVHLWGTSPRILHWCTSVDRGSVAPISPTWSSTCRHCRTSSWSQPTTLGTPGSCVCSPHREDYMCSVPLASILLLPFYAIPKQHSFIMYLTIYGMW